MFRNLIRLIAVTQRLSIKRSYFSCEYFVFRLFHRIHTMQTHMVATSNRVSTQKTYIRLIKYLHYYQR